MGQGDSTEQNVTFVDTHPGYVLTQNSGFDPLRDHALEGDATLEEFFSRPIKIASFDWPVGGNVHQVFDPWSLYFENPRVINRLANYRLLRSKLHVKFTISGNGFHYGRLLAAYNPMPLQDDLTVDRNYVDADFVAATQRPHIFLDPTNSQGGEMILPFFYDKNVLDVTTSAWSSLGEMVISSLQKLKHANGASDEVTVNVFAWAEEHKFAIPTEKAPSTIQPQSNEYDTKGPVSKVAGVIAAVAGKLTSVPAIGTFARATEIGAIGVGALATLFGYSRPVMLESSQYRPMTKPNLAVTNVCDDTIKLTVDCKQELTIDPVTVGLDSVDELGINYIASKESYWQNFAWPVGTTSEALLFNGVVDPGVFRQNGPEQHLPACNFASLPFKYWRGSMKYRFQVVCSKYHKGRLKIVYDPCSTSTSSAGSEYNTAYTTVVDIADTTDFSVTIGWGQDTTYRQRVPFGADQSEFEFSDTFPLAYDSSTHPSGNGTIAVYVVNELTVPDTTIDNDIAINIFVSAGDDFEVAVPTSQYLRRINLTTASSLVQPQAEETQRMDSTPHGPPVISSHAALTSLTDKTNLVHFGEHVRSFRQLVKRYGLYDNVPLDFENPIPGNEQYLILRRDSFPWEGGYTSGTGDYTDVLVNGSYVYNHMTFLRYVTTGYAGWRGGIRWMYDASALTKPPGSQFPTVFVGNSHPTSNVSNTLLRIPAVAVTLPAGRSSQIGFFQEVGGHDGIAMQSTLTNPTTCFEVPFYSEHRFAPAKARATWDSKRTDSVPTYAVIVPCQTGNGTESFKTSVSAAEDFTCFFFLGAPIFYDRGPFLPAA